MTATFHSKNPALQDSILVFNQDCELVSQLPNQNILLIFAIYSMGLIFAQIQKEQFLCSRPFVILLETQKRKEKL